MTVIGDLHQLSYWESDALHTNKTRDLHRCFYRVVRYELQYAVAGRGVANDDNAVWQAVEGDGKDTWDITVRVDGFDRFAEGSLTLGHTLLTDPAKKRIDDIGNCIYSRDRLRRGSQEKVLGYIIFRFCPQTKAGIPLKRGLLKCLPLN